jgi:hypothetical protein
MPFIFNGLRNLMDRLQKVNNFKKRETG